MDSFRIWRRANAQSSFAWNCLSYCLGSSFALVCVSCWAQETAPTVVPVAPVAAPTSQADSAVSPSDTTGTASEESTTSVKQPSDKKRGHDDDAKLEPAPPGYVHLLFRDHKWLPALQWLAEQLKMNLDWQSLPEGEFSLHSTQPYTLEEAEDLINMQLLARGFTLLKRGEVLRVVPLKELDITLVPRVDADQLETLRPHTFARVSFTLDWMIADEAVEEFKPLVSPYGMLSAMRSSNRLEVMDAVINLREMHRLLVRAEHEDARRERVAEFKLEHRRADDVVAKVRQLLGLPEANPAPSTLTQLDIEQAKFKAEAIKQMGTGAKELIKEKKVDVFLTINDKENSILCNAPPNKIEIVRQAIEAIDKPLPDTESTWSTLSRVKLHDVEGFDPKAITVLLASLQEQGNLGKDARFQYEAAYNRIIAFASAQDQLTIAQVIDSFRAKRRSATVLPLGSIDAEYAVSAIQLVLKNPIRPPAAPGVASDGTFQVEADPDHKRLLLWASEEEVKEVQQFLKSLGSSDVASTTNNNMQVISLNGAPLREVSSRLQRVWSELSDAPLIVEPIADSTSESTTAPAIQPASDSPAKDVNEAVQRKKDVTQISNSNIRLISSSVDRDQQKAAQQDPKQPSQAPVRLIEGDNGEVMILSRDPVAAETARKLLEGLLPEPSSVSVIALKHAQANVIKRQLEELLQEDKPLVPPTAAATAIPKLAKRPQQMKLDPDLRTNRILIRNASELQLKRVRQLVEVLDQPVNSDDRLARQQKVYRFKHRKAEEVATMVKEVYRDLLSINDRIFSSSTATSPRGSFGYNQNLAATASNPEYQGLLSVGIDIESNLLVVSAPTYLIDEIVKLVESVDTPNDGNTVSIIEFSSPGTKDSLTREALSRILQAKRK